MSVLSLAAAKAHLSLTADSTVDDAKLQAVIDAAEAAIAEIVGPLEPISVTERVRGGVSSIMLRHDPVISLTSLTPILGPTFNLTDLYLDTETGIVTHVWGWTFIAFAYDVTYQVGRTSVPEDLMMAIKELLRHMWGPQRGAINRGVATPTEPGPGFMMPNRVMELIGPHRSVGIA